MQRSTGFEKTVLLRFLFDLVYFRISLPLCMKNKKPCRQPAHSMSASTTVLCRYNSGYT